MDAFMNEEMISCCNEDIAVELLVVTTVVTTSLPSNGTTNNGISINSNISRERNNCHHMMYLPLFERTWLKMMMAFLTACSWCSDSIPGNCQFEQTRHPKTDHQRRAKKTVGCGTHLATSGVTSFTVDLSPYVDRVALLTGAPLTLTTVDGQQAIISLAAVESDLGVSDIVAINSTDSDNGATVDSVQYTLGYRNVAKGEIGA